MQARVTTFDVKLDHTDDGTRFFQEGIPAIRQLDGFHDALLLVDRQRGAAMTIALWEDQQSLHDAAGAAGSLFQKAAHTIEGEPQQRIYEVLVHEPKATRRFARVSTMTVDPSALDAAPTAIITAASQQPGYAGFLVLINRENNTRIGVSFWDSQEHLEASDSGYYASEMDKLKNRDRFAGGQWSRDVYEVAAQA